MAVPPDKVDVVRESLSSAITSGPDATAAKRTLKSLCKQDPTIEANEANVKLVVALKACRVGYLNLDTFKNYKNVLEIRETVEQKVYIIEKAARPDLDTTEGFMGFGEESWLHHPDSVSTSVEKGRYWFIDQGCTRLPKGALAIKASVSIVHAGNAAGEEIPGLNMFGPSGNRAAEEPAAGAAADAGERAPTSVARGNGMQPTSPQRRPLEKRDSETMTDEEFQIHLLKTVQEKFEAACYDSDDPNEDTVRSLLRRFKMYVRTCVQNKGETQTALDSIPEAMQTFFKHVLGTLVKKPSYDWIGPMIPELEEILQICPELSNGVGQAVLRVQNSPVDAMEELNLDCLGFKQYAFFKDTEYYKSYMRARKEAFRVRREERIAQIRSLVDMPIPERAAEVDILLKGGEDQELLVAKTMLSSVSEIDKCKYLLRSEGAIVHMESWFPRDPKLSVRFFLAGLKYKEVEPSDFLKGVDFISGHGEVLISNIANPVVRSVVLFYSKMKSLLSQLSETPQMLLSELDEMPQMLLSELAFAKLGLSLPKDHQAPKAGIDEAVAVNVLKLVEPVLRRVP